jgi:PAS domain S-box-containing protein
MNDRSRGGPPDRPVTESAPDLYRAIVESLIDDAIIMIDPDGRIEMWSAGAERVFGHTPGEVVGRAFGEVCPGGAGAARAMTEESRRSGHAEGAGPCLRADGSTFWALTELAPILDDGRVRGYACVVRDNTASHREEQLLQLAVDASPHGMVMVDERGRITLCNPRMAAKFGYRQDELIGTPIDALLPERYRSGHARHRAAFSADPHARPMGPGRDLFGLHREGHEFPVEIGLTPVTIEGRAHVLASVIDISERKRGEHALAEREARLRALMDHANDCITVLTTDGTIVDVNERMAETLGLTRDELIGKRISDVTALPPDQVMREFSADLPLGIAGKGFFRRTALKGPGGKHVLMDFSLSEVKLGGEDLFLSIGRDMTAYEHLQNQLRQAQKMEAIGRLAGGVAHDFNNLLTVINGNVDILVDTGRMSAEALDLLGDVRKAGDRASGLTRQLLAFSRKQMLKPSIIDVPELVHSIDRMLRRIMREDIRLETAIGRDVSTVFADPGQLEQVIINLAVNARDAMPDAGTLTIEVANTHLDATYVSEHEPVKPGPYVLIAVSDTGVGMAPEVRSRVFEPFFTTKEAGKGTGLGLATVYGIVKQSGGFIWVYSEPGHGSTFKVYLPARSTQALPDTTAVEAGPVGGSERIILVEDDELVRGVARRALAAHGYEILEAETPEQALGFASDADLDIDLLVTDVIMPGINGPALAQRIGTLRPGIRVIYMSGYTDEAIIRHGVLEKGIAFLQKPYTPRALARLVREVLDGAVPGVISPTAD